MTKLPERKKNVCGKEKESPRKSEEKYRDILENIEEGYYEEDLAGNFTFFNSSMCRIYGYSRDELMGMNYRQYTDKETAKKLREVFNDIYRTGNSNISYSYELIRKDGAKKYIEASASIKKDSSNKPIGFRGIIRDVTGSKQAEEALKKSEEKYRTLLDNASDAILLANDEGNLLEVNKKAEELLGYTRKELLEVNIARIHPPEELEKIINGFKKIIQNGLGTVNDTAVLRKGGKKVFVDISGNVIEYSGQKVLQGIFRDITERKKMEDDLRKSEQRYRNILENIREGYYELDLDGNYTFANEANCRYLGYTKEELIGMNYRRHTNEENVRKLYKPYRELYRTCKSIETLELESIRKDGTKATYETSVSLIRDEKGNPIGFRGVSRDVTERRKTENALRQSEEKYRTILEEMEEAYFEVDLAGNFTFINDAECRHLGYSREELIGMNNRQYTDEENAKKVYQAFSQIYKTREPYKVFDYEVIKKDGTKEVSELLVSLIKDSSGKPIGFRGLARLITERKKMEEMLLQSEGKYRTILENIEEGYFEDDFSGKFTFVNDIMCSNLGYSREELIGMSYRQYTDEKNASKLRELYERLYKTGKPIKEFDLEAINKNGIKLIYKTSAFLMRDPKGEPIGFRGVSRNITERKQAEEKLRKSEEKYRNILENMQEGYFELDLAGNLTFVNDAECRNIGYPREELIGMNNRQYQDETTAQETYQLFRRLYRTGEPIEALDVGIIRKNGTKGFNEISVSLIRDAEGKPIGFRGISRDITERKKMQEDLHQSEEKYRTILEDIEEGYFEMDLAGNATYFNDSICRIFGYPREELLHMNYKQYTDKENGKKCFQIYNEIYKTGKPDKAYDYEIIRKDGTTRNLETSLSLQKDSAGNPIGFRGISRDITERKQTEAALRESEEKYRNILEHIQEGYFELDLTGTYTFVNDAECRNIGYPREELIGMNNRQYQDEATIKRMYQAFNTMYKTGKSIKIMDIEIIQKDGTKKFNEISVALLRDSKGKKIGFSGVSRDITERKLADDALKKNQEELVKKNKELEESRKNVQLTLERLGAAYEELKTTQAKIIQQEKMASIGQLAAGVAHEINNPMAFIASNLGTLDKYIRRLKDFIQAQSEAIKSLKATDAIKKLEKKRKELKLDYTINDIDLLVKESRDGSERVQKIVRELNRFSRTGDEEYKDTNINECIESSINIVWNELKQKATLHKDYGNLPQTKCYPQKLNQVFVNLLVNAIHAIEKKGKIKIKTWEKDGSIWVAVSDTGCGISRENQSKIFEPFFTTKEVGKGTGLGLSISYEIMQRHKGELSFQSEKGKGTTFTIRMPIV